MVSNVCDMVIIHAAGIKMVKGDNPHSQIMLTDSVVGVERVNAQCQIMLTNNWMVRSMYCSYNTRYGSYIYLVYHGVSCDNRGESQTVTGNPLI